MGHPKWLLFFKNMVHQIQEDDVSALGAQMTFYLILAFFPFLIFLLAILNYTPLTSEHVMIQIAPFLAEDTMSLIESFVYDTFTTNSGTLLSFGMIGAIWASSNGMNGIIRGLNKAYQIQERRPFWKDRGLSIMLTIGLIIVIILTLVLLIFGKNIGEELFEHLYLPEYFGSVWAMIQYVIPLTMMFIVFLFLYKITPNLKLTFREVLPGTVFAVLGWVSISLLFATYVNQWGNYSQMYGSIGGIIVLLLWLYISSIIILIGGELNAVLSSMRNKK